MLAVGASALRRRGGAACLPLMQAAWQRQGGRKWASGVAGDGGSSEAAAGWSLTQRYGGTATTAAAATAAAGAPVLLERRFEDSSGEQPAASSLPLGRLRQTTLSQLQATFLPSGYPHTVAPGYLRNTLWQAVHHTAGSANGVLASTFLLYSVGLGAGAVPTAGALNWVLKDGLGQLGTLLFGKAIAHNFDVSSRAWYLLASAKLNLAMGLEICTFLLPQHFLPIGALANAIKGLSWMAGGSTKSVFKVSFAADNNFGDVSAKATSQTICASVVGTSAGVALASQVGQSVGLALGCYASLAALHMWTGYMAVRCVPLATLNPSRLELLVRHYLGALHAPTEEQPPAEQQQRPAQQQRQSAKQQPAQRQQQQQEQGPAGPQAWQQEAGAEGKLQQNVQQPHAAWRAQHPEQHAAVVLPSPAQLAGEDAVFHSPWLNIGTPLSKLARQQGSHLSAVMQQQLAQQAQQEGTEPLRPALHLLVPDGSSGMHLLLHEQAGSADCILGYLHAYLLHYGGSSRDGSSSSMTTSSRRSSSSGDGSSASSSGGHVSSSSSSSSAQLARALADARRLLPGLLAALEAAGWDDQKVVLEAKRRRVTW